MAIAQPSPRQRIPALEACGVTQPGAVRRFLYVLTRRRERAPGLVLSMARSPEGDEVRFEYLVDEGWRGDTVALARQLAATLDSGEATVDQRVRVDLYRGDLGKSELDRLPLVASAAR